MIRKSVPKNLILYAICACIFLPAVFGQAKPAAQIGITKCWAYPLTDETGSGLAADAANVYTNGAGAKVEALSLEGKKLWATEFGGEVNSNLLPTENGLMFVTSTASGDLDKGASTNLLRLVSSETGITIWASKLLGAESHFLAKYRDALVIVSQNGAIQSVDAKTGTTRWRREVAAGFAGQPFFSGDRLVAVSATNQVFVVSLASGEIASIRKLPFSVTAVSQMANGDLIAGDERGIVAEYIGVSDQTNWKFRSGGKVSAIFTIGDHLLVTSHDNFAYSLRTRNGSVVWRKRLSGRVSRIATFMDQYALISGFEDHSVVVINLLNGKTATQIPFGANERLNTDPIVSNRRVFILTNESIYLFSLGTCPGK
ncbi:MAG: PQQ-binding-like beta-propeller repeat protein [Pyrinomonadaceae bacterium]